MPEESDELNGPAYLPKNILDHTIQSIILAQSLDGISLASEVGLLTRNVKVIGGGYDGIHEQSFGGRIFVGEHFDGFQQWTGTLQFKL